MVREELGHSCRIQRDCQELTQDLGLSDYEGGIGGAFSNTLA